MAICNICNGTFNDSPDSVVMCKHHAGAVHLGCCTDVCSEQGSPCEHSCGIYDKQE